VNKVLRYDLMVEEALRGVVRQALSGAAADGLIGEQHFYVTFRTDLPGVILSDHLRNRYPQEMTIVLQHRFWGLQVAEDHFEVTLSFQDVPERLVIPFAAVSAFADPSVRFGLQFASTAALPAATGDAPSQTAAQAAAQGTTPTAESPSPPATDSGPKVVTLDQFRRKS